MHAHIIFRLNKNLDKAVADDFINTSEGGIDFSKGVINPHPPLEKTLRISGVRRRKQVINAYVDAFYAKYQNYLKKRIHEFLEQWSGVEKEFFSIIHELLPGYRLLNGVYSGYLSIFDCNPRFLSSKSFQIFHMHSLGVRYVTMHELLHFVFYNYTKRRFRHVFKGLDTEHGLWWDCAEIFNTVVLSGSEFAKIHGIKKIVSYPEHKRYIAQLRRAWRNNRDIDALIVKIISALRKR
jgi:hypothetical protein